MSEERFDRMENTLSQIITMLGNVMEEQTAMKTDQATMKEELTTLKDMQAAMKADQATMWKEITAMKKESKEQHTEVMDKLKSIEANQEHILEKAARNEREFARFKNQFHL
ncbi:hypothetical protein OBCHQ24_13390 [Oceanobacillus iheyensis]|nr:hypothetical protein OBCHQ24_13390 [Oceanobacillus iheyensis]NAO99823.1 hypothetical protein [Halomonas sp. MG34]